MRRGEIWWGEAPDSKGRPYLILTRSDAIAYLHSVVVAAVSRTIRGIPSEVPLGADEGLPQECVASMDNVRTFSKGMLVRRMGDLGPVGWAGACRAMAAAFDC